MQYRVTFNRPYLVGSEFERMQEAVGGLIIAEGGPFTERCERLLERIMGAPHALLTSSCTHALEMSALLLDLKPGDEVVMPTFTFVSTANAYALRGARPVFADIRPDTMNLDEGSLSDRIGPRTRAIVVVHYAGVGCEMDEIERIAEDAGVTLIEDNAHGLPGAYRGKPLGTFGAMATQSFHETKNLTCGKGGALVLNDTDLFERARNIRNKGTNRDQFFEGQVDKYTWVDLGSSYLPPDLLSAFLLCQLEARDHIQQRRQSIWHRYQLELTDWANAGGVQLPAVPEHVEQAYHMFYLLLPTHSDRDRLIAHLRDDGVQAVFHYIPLHVSPMGQSFGAKEGDCPVAEDVSGRLVRLPFFTGMTEHDQTAVVSAVEEFRCG
ncbi:MAG: dTDP-4-amino-4,6-dideoxygalactose transaminase [Gemmatimonadetes bacterium]|nr:dTDP-4-amino-4,6-dideoxygalactose transaminase [Gemmatimonadota bacterium]